MDANINRRSSIECSNDRKEIFKFLKKGFGAKAICRKLNEKKEANGMIPVKKRTVERDIEIIKKTNGFDDMMELLSDLDKLNLENYDY